MRRFPSRTSASSMSSRRHFLTSVHLYRCSCERPRNAMMSKCPPPSTHGRDNRHVSLVLLRVRCHRPPVSANPNSDYPLTERQKYHSKPLRVHVGPRSPSETIGFHRMTETSIHHRRVHRRYWVKDYWV